MTVTQIYTLMNQITQEYEGVTTVLTEDLQNVVDLGGDIENVIGVDNFVKSLTDHIGRMIFVDRKYAGRAPSVLMDGWEYGSILEKISVELMEAKENDSWALNDGESYDQDIFYKPNVTAKFWNKRITFEIPISITKKQVKSAFSNATQLNSFISMIYTAVENSLTVKIDSLIMRTINNMIAETIYNEYTSGDYSTSSGVRAVNLLYLYKQKNPDTTLTKENCIYDTDFIKYASMTMRNYVNRLQVMSTLFNVGGKERFTPSDKLHFVLLSEFAESANTYLQSDTFHNEFVKLPDAQAVAFWQGSGTDYAFTSTSKIDVTTSAGNKVSIDGVLGTMFDHDALGVCNVDRRVTNHYNAKAEFWNNWYKFDSGYFNDLNENLVVFFVA